MIGSLIGFFSLACLTLCLYLCCRLFWLVIDLKYFFEFDVHFSLNAARPYVYENEASIELYHIERCMDPDCSWPNLPDRWESSLISRKRHTDGKNSSHSQMKRLNSLLLTEENSVESGNEWEMLEIGSDLPSSRMKTRPRRQSMSGVSVTRIKSSEKLSNIGNPHIKHPDRSLDELTSELSEKNRKNAQNVQITRVKYAEKPRPHSSARIVRVTSLLSKTPTSDRSLRFSGNTKKNQVAVTRVPFHHQKKQIFLRDDETAHSALSISSSTIPILSRSKRIRHPSSSIAPISSKKIKDN